MSDDTADLNHENSLLASTYLDGEATSDERALVETSPEALAEVEALSEVRAVLAATAPTPSLSEREGHLAGALDVWERMSERERAGQVTPARGVDAAAAAAVTTSSSTSDGRRGRSGPGRVKRVGSVGASQWLLGAAATLVVLAGGAAVVRGILDQDADTNQVAIEADVEDGAELSELEANEAAEVMGDNVGGDFAPNATDVSDEVARDPEAPLPESDATASATAEDSAEESAEDATGVSEQPAPAGESDRIDLRTRDDLADYGSLAVIGIRSGALPADDTRIEPPFDGCEARFGIEELLEPARYRGQDVFVGVDLDRDVVYAFTEGCVLVESSPLPPSTAQP